jgi:hypothetical protein
MAEVERVRERERPPLKDNPYERVMAQRKALAERNLTGPVVIDCTQQEWFQARQGKLKFFLDPVSFKNTPLQQWRVFIHDIKTRSGKHRHQGGLVIYVLAGKGYSIVEGERKDWERGDLVLLPMKPGLHQHPDPRVPRLRSQAGGGLTGFQGGPIRPHHPEGAGEGPRRNGQQKPSASRPAPPAPQGESNSHGED